MKVRIIHTVEASDEYRRAINHHHGKDGMASRGDVRRWNMAHGSSCDYDLIHDLRAGTNWRGRSAG